MFDIYREIVQTQSSLVNAIMFFEVKSPRRARVIGAGTRPTTFVSFTTMRNLPQHYITMMISKCGRFGMDFKWWDESTFKNPYDLRSGRDVKAWQKLERQ